MTRSERIHALFSGARAAMRLAHECKTEVGDLVAGQAYRDYRAAEAKRHRERAAWYLERRKWILEDRWHGGQ